MLLDLFSLEYGNLQPAVIIGGSGDKDDEERKLKDYQRYLKKKKLRLQQQAKKLKTQHKKEAIAGKVVQIEELQQQIESIIEREDYSWLFARINQSHVYYGLETNRQINLSRFAKAFQEFLDEEEEDQIMLLLLND